MIDTIAMTAYLMTAMMTWVPLSQHTFYEKEEKTRARYHDIAATIADVSLDEKVEPLFEGEDGRIKTALLLAAIGSTESFYNRDVVECKRAGDQGLAWGTWQTHSNKFKTCRSLKDAAMIAYGMIKTSFWCCRNYPLLDRLCIYTTGKCHRDWKPSRFRMSRALDWLTSHPLKAPSTMCHAPPPLVSMMPDDPVSCGE